MRKIQLYTELMCKGTSRSTLGSNSYPQTGQGPENATNKSTLCLNAKMFSYYFNNGTIKE